jgi:hypothetical protein
MILAYSQLERSMPCTHGKVGWIVILHYLTCTLSTTNLKMFPLMLSLYMLTLSKYDPLYATHTSPHGRDDLHLGHGDVLVPFMKL